MWNSILLASLVILYWLLNAVLVTIVATVYCPEQMKSREDFGDMVYTFAMASMIFAPLGILFVVSVLFISIFNKLVPAVVDKTIELQEGKPDIDENDPQYHLLRGSASNKRAGK